MSNMPEGDINGVLADLERRIYDLERTSRLVSASIGEGGIRSEDFDGDRDDPEGDPGTAGWFLGAAAAVFNTLVLRDQIIGPESLGITWDGDGESLQNFFVPGGGGYILEGEIPVPDWASQALVWCMVNASVRNDRASADFGYLQAAVDGTNGGDAFTLFSAGGWGSLSATAIRLVSGASLGSTITPAARMRTDSGINWSANTGHIVNMDAIALFKK